MTTWLTADRCVLGGAGQALRCVPACLRVEGGVIREVREHGDAARRSAEAARLAQGGDHVEDFGHRLLTPAFVNAHTHLALVFLRGADPGLASDLVEDFYFRHEARLAADDVRAFARLGAYESLLAGVGCVWDHYYHGEAVAQALREVGLCGVVAPTLQDLDGPGRRGHREALDATERIASSPDYAAAGVYAAAGPHATDTVSEALFAEALALCGRHDLPMHLHCAQSSREVRRVHARTGLSPVAWLQRLGVLDGAPQLLLAHGLYMSRAELALLDPARHALALCPHAQLVFDFPAALDSWCEAGVRWVLATDCASSNDSMALQKELRAAAGLATAGVSWSAPHRALLDHAGPETAAQVRALRDRRRDALAPQLTPAALLERVWATPGALHPAFRAGALAPGHLANVVVWDPHHPSLWPARDPLRGLAMGDTAGAIHAMFVRGRPLGSAGAFQHSLLTSDAYREAREEASRRLSSLGVG